MSKQMEAKNNNRNNIYQLIHHSEGIAKQEIAAALQLSLPTVAQSLQLLKEKGLIQENGTFASTGGRRAKVLSCVADARVALGLDITKNHVSLVFVDLAGNVLFSQRDRLVFSHEDAYFEQLGHTITKFIQSNGMEEGCILGMGVALPAIVADDNRSISYAKVFNAKPDFFQRLAQVVTLPFALYNDANAAGFAEFWNKKVSYTKETIVYLSLSNSVGGSIVNKNAVYYGENQRGGEFGHMSIVPEGRDCYCGQKGCVDAYCSASLLAELEDGRLENFFEKLKQGDASCKQAFATYLYYLSLVVNNLRMCFDCQVILGGYVGSFLEEYLDELRNLVAQRNTFEVDGSYVHACNYKFESSAVGAALHFIEAFINEI